MTELLERADVNGAEPRPATATDSAGRTEALRRLKKKRDFKTHVLAYLLVNGSLWAIYALIAALDGAIFPWPIFPTLGWLIGLVLHAWDTYGQKPFSEEQIERELKRLTR